MELTKEQRNEIYSEAYDTYLDYIKYNNIKVGMCFCLNQSAYKLGHYSIDLYFDLPEFISLKGDKSMSEHWWDRRETEPRINAFKEMINLTK